MVLCVLCYVVVALCAIFATAWWRRLQHVRDKLKWASAARGYPFLGNALDFRDPTKLLGTMSSLLAEHNGICYVELLGRPVLLATDHKLLEYVLSSSTLIRKGSEYRTLQDWFQGGLLLTYGAEWKKSRRILTPAFHFTILEQFVNVFEKPASTLVKILNKQVGNDSVDVSPYISNFTLDLICETAMGVPMDIQDNPNSEYAFAVKEMSRFVEERAFNPIKMLDVTYRFTKDYRLQKKYIELLHSVSNAVIDKRRRTLEEEKEEEEEREQAAEGRKKKTAFLDLLLKYRDENGRPLPRDYVRQEVDTFMFAGHDTSATAISFAMYLLAGHPDVQEKVLEEVRDVLGDDQKITYRHLQDMKYLETVIKETLRVYPPVTAASRLIDRDVVFEGDKVIPKGTTVMIFIYGVHQDAKVYEEPRKFDPARWFDTGTGKSAYSFVPFSAGPRNCIGQKFAMLEIKYALAKILLNFELVPTDPKHELVLVSETVLRSKNGIRIKLKKRGETPLK